MKRELVVLVMLICGGLFFLPVSAESSDMVTSNFQGQFIMQSNHVTGITFRPELADAFLAVGKGPISEAYYAGGSGGKKKSPGLAVLFSLLIPGGGQWYNGQIGKGFAFLGGYVGGTIVAIVGAVSSADDIINFDNQGNLNLNNASGGSSAVLYAGLGIMAGTYIWSCVHAYKTATKINEQGHANGFRLFHDPKTGRAFSFSLDPMITSSGSAGGQLALRAVF